MNNEEYIPLNRQFSLVTKNDKGIENEDFNYSYGRSDTKGWDELNDEFRSVILAEAGAGKTEELRNRAIFLSSEDRASFFIRIEDIEADFREAFEVGTEEQFEEWLESTEEAWFFLDSVDEARLESPTALRKALRRFAKSIECGAHRAHIYLSSRPYAWRPNEDRRLFDEFLFLTSPNQESNESVDQGVNPKSALNVYFIKPLDKAKIRQFSEAREAQDIDQLLMEIERVNLWSLAERPFDLDSILSKWNQERVLGGRLELLRYNIYNRLRDDHNCDRSQQRTLTLERAKEGARRLAAAVVLSGEAGVHIPDGKSTKSGIEAEVILADWSLQEVNALLELGIFNDILFGIVRFRHREVRELLAAEWFDYLLKSGSSRHAITGLFFREQYGETIVPPRLRSILPWLILFDCEIRAKVLTHQPEIVVEGGDPSQIPYLERKEILNSIVSRIVLNEDEHSARDNSAIARIANKDLSNNTLQLVEEHYKNDEAIFFLGRLIWQGEMVDCVAPMISIAVDASRGIYARIASARAVMNCGTYDQKRSLWQGINRSECQIPPRLLSELLDGTQPDISSVENIVISLGKLPRFKKYDFSSMSYSLHDFINRFNIVGDEEIIFLFVQGLYAYLESSPYIERGECHVSKDYAWLLGHAIHALEGLVETKQAVVLGSNAISIILMVPALRFWREGEFDEHKGNLRELVPSWPELNDAIYWASIDQAKIRHATKSNDPLVDDWKVSFLGHLWKFDKASLPRLLNLMHCCEEDNDKLILLSTAFQVYLKSDKEINILEQLEEAIEDDPMLIKRFDIMLNPPLTDAQKVHKKQHEDYSKKSDEKDLQERLDREKWIAELRANPNRLYNYAEIESGVCTNDQIWLRSEIQREGLSIKRNDGYDWRALISDFGEEVASAYRQALITLWRNYKPYLQSEGDLRNGSVSYSLSLAMVGLEIEALESPSFPLNLSEPEFNHVLRYLTWEINGFPSWFERMHKAFPKLVEEAVVKELLWELENTNVDTNESASYILQGLAHSASWIHSFIAPLLLAWMEADKSRLSRNKYDCFRILINGGIDSVKLAELASCGLAESKTLDETAWWYALLVDCDPFNGIPRVEQWLLEQGEVNAKNSAQIFITALMGGRYSINNTTYLNNYRTPKHLKSLYSLMLEYVRTGDDIDRANVGVFSPGLRDDAQDARDNLFNLLSNIPGKASYTLIKQLSHEHPDRPWMTKQAYKRAEEDGDLEIWSADQIRAFNDKQEIIPRTHRQLFDLSVNRLIDLKNWLERGNDSPWQTWQRVTSENEMRNLIAGWLNLKCGSHYITAQEPELANSQRMDIWLHNTNALSPVPIELKLLDKEWSGPKLCERLRNQLAGDYLREESAGCGVMLLVACHLAPSKKWSVNGEKVEIKKLAGALKSYWNGISGQYPGVSELEVIVINLNERKLKCDT